MLARGCVKRIMMTMDQRLFENNKIKSLLTHKNEITILKLTSIHKHNSRTTQRFGRTIVQIRKFHRRFIVKAKHFATNAGVKWQRNARTKRLSSPTVRRLKETKLGARLIRPLSNANTGFTFVWTKKVSFERKNLKFDVFFW